MTRSGNYLNAESPSVNLKTALNESLKFLEHMHNMLLLKFFKSGMFEETIPGEATMWLQKQLVQTKVTLEYKKSCLH